MNALFETFAVSFTAALFCSPLFADDQKAQPLVFNTTAPTNDLKGPFAAHVQFAQSQIIPANPRKDDRQPHLIANRKALLLVRPLKADGTTILRVAALDKAKKRLGVISLSPPEKLPKTAYFLEGLPDEKIEFDSNLSAITIINDPANLEKLKDAKAAFLSEHLRKNAIVEIQTANGQWIGAIHIPRGEEFNDKLLRVSSSADYASTIYYSGRSVVITRGQSLFFRCVQGNWIHAGELENQNLIYATDTWSGVLPAEWIAPGLSLHFEQGNLRGELTNLEVGPPTELLIHTIDVGMLLPPRGQFAFANDIDAHREYFQTVPVSRMIVSQYESIFLREVMLPDGTFLTDQDPSKGDWHNGTMRQNIGKELISLGIDNANYGINSSAGGGEDSHPYIVAQLAAHNTQGKYSNGVVVHGGSGGGGIVTLDNSIGNELSHEVGHNYGLGHYVDGFKGSVHRPADQINSTWGWDADKNRFIPNFWPVRGGQDTCVEGGCQSPFDGRAFGKDAMAGGEPLSGFNRFTLYTPNSAAIIQKFLESKAVFDANSPTGYSKWNPAKSRMEPYEHNLSLATEFSAPVNDLSETKIASFLADYDAVKVSMQDGNWTKFIYIPAASAANRGRMVTIDHDAGFESFLAINGRPIKVTRGYKKSFTSDGKRWKEGSASKQMVDRKPQAFGVPVTTLVGYYDPKGELRSYIYPALHGAYGFTYDDDRSRLNDDDCYLLVETRDGPLKFRLANHRLSASVMNKFHVNISEASEPKSAALVCGEKTVDKRPIVALDGRLTFTVNPSYSHTRGSLDAGSKPRPAP